MQNFMRWALLGPQHGSHSWVLYMRLGHKVGLGLVRAPISRFLGPSANLVCQILVFDNSY